jgi:anti-sigma B factor antagonist
MTERRYSVSGELDIAVAPELQEKLLVLVNATNDDLVLDCADLEFVDSTGVAVFVHTQQLLSVNGRRLRVENLHGMARRTFDIVGLTESMEGEPDDEPEAALPDGGQGGTAG